MQSKISKLIKPCLIKLETLKQVENLIIYPSKYCMISFSNSKLLKKFWFVEWIVQGLLVPNIKSCYDIATRKSIAQNKITSSSILA